MQSIKNNPILNYIYDILTELKNPWEAYHTVQGPGPYKN